MLGERVKPAGIPVILATKRAGDWEALESMLAGSPWELICSPSVSDVLKALHQITVPIVLCDQHFDGQPWQETVRAFLRARRRSSVTLLTDTGGPEFYAELARRGGFDLLARPFERDQVYATLLCAYARGRAHWQLLPHRRAVSPAPECDTVPSRSG